MYHFFPGNYMWSQAVLRVLFTGGSIGEVVKLVEGLQDASADYDAEAWYTAWRGMGDLVWDRASVELSEGHTVSARGSFLRACNYYQSAIPFMDHADPRRLETHARSVEAFGRFASNLEPAAQLVEVPYEGTSFPAWFFPGVGEGPKPTAFYLPGWDSTKEQGVGLALALAERGLNVLSCDGPGIGDAVLSRGLVNRYDYEVPGRAIVDYLQGRPDVDPAKIAVVGASMGGYRAGRVASFEHRLAAAVAWGAVWDFGEVWERRRANPRGALPTPSGHALHVMGASTLDEVSELMKPWRLEGVIGRIACPLLVLHGEKDAQIFVEDAYRVYESAGSPQKELKIFTEAETGSAHCQNDNRVLAHDYIGDWLVDVLLRGSRRSGVHAGPVHHATAGA